MRRPFIASESFDSGLDLTHPHIGTDGVVSVWSHVNSRVTKADVLVIIRRLFWHSSIPLLLRLSSTRWPAILIKERGWLTVRSSTFLVRLEVSLWTLTETQIILYFVLEGACHVEIRGWLFGRSWFLCIICRWRACDQVFIIKNCLFGLYISSIFFVFWISIGLMMTNFTFCMRLALVFGNEWTYSTSRGA